MAKSADATRRIRFSSPKGPQSNWPIKALTKAIFHKCLNYKQWNSTQIVCFSTHITSYKCITCDEEQLWLNSQAIFFSFSHSVYECISWYLFLTLISRLHLKCDYANCLLSPMAANRACVTVLAMAFKWATLSMQYCFSIQFILFLLNEWSCLHDQTFISICFSYFSLW